MIYGHNKTIHRTNLLNIEVDKKGNVVSIWFRCCALPFDVTIVDKGRADDMRRMYNETVNSVKLNAVDVDYLDKVKHEPPDPTCGESKTPLGWYCTRLLGHEGPCAAKELGS